MGGGGGRREKATLSKEIGCLLFASFPTPARRVIRYRRRSILYTYITLPVKRSNEQPTLAPTPTKLMQPPKKKKTSRSKLSSSDCLLEI